MPRPVISVLILTKDPDQRLYCLLESTRGQVVEADVEIVMVDSGSRTPLDGLAREFGAVLLSVPAESFAHGRTRNQAAEISKGEYIVFISQDAVPCGRSWLASLLFRIR